MREQSLRSHGLWLFAISAGVCVVLAGAPAAAFAADATTTDSGQSEVATAGTTGSVDVVNTKSATTPDASATDDASADDAKSTTSDPTATDPTTTDTTKSTDSAATGADTTKSTTDATDADTTKSTDSAVTDATTPATDVNAVVAAEASPSASETESLAPAGVAHNTDLKSGQYYIGSEVGTSASDCQVVSVANNSAKAGSNVESDSWVVGSAGQLWNFILHVDGSYYVISRSGTNGSKVLQMNSDGGVVLGDYIGSDGQKWYLVHNANGTYSIVSKSNESKALNVVNGGTTSGTDVNAANTNSSSAAQQFFVGDKEAYSEHIGSKISNGIYNITSKLNSSNAFSIAANSNATGGQLQVDGYSNSFNQKFEIEQVDGNKYKIRTASSGGWLTSSSISGGQQVTQVGTSSTLVNDCLTWTAKWINGFFSFINTATGLALNVANPSVQDSKVTTESASESSSNQLFKLTADALIQPGYYYLKSSLGTVAEIVGKQTTSGAALIANAAANENYQKYYIDNYGAYYNIRNINSDLYVSSNGDNSGAAVVQQFWRGDGHQYWDVKIADGGYIVFKNFGSQKLLDVAGDNAGANVAVVQLASQAEGGDHQGQKWSLAKTSVWGWVCPNGNYYFYDDSGNKITNCNDWKIYSAWQTIAGMNSYTPYAITIDQDNCDVCIFTGYAGHWAPLVINGESYCNIGIGCGCTELGCTANGTFFTTGWKSYCMDAPSGEYYFTTFYPTDTPDGEGFHTVLIGSAASDASNRDEGGQTRQPISHGCCRMAPFYASWIFYNINAGTRVNSWRNW